MEFNLKIKGDKLGPRDENIEFVTGNVNSYICNFEILTDSELTWVCVFKQGENAYQQVIVDGKCVVPKEVLENTGKVKIGCYATNGEKRISTNLYYLPVDEGAYCEANKPDEPTPDVWEVIVMNSLPYIGENGNWYVYDRLNGEYTDSGKQAKGDKGDMPIKGVDYWNEADKAEIKSYVEEAILGGEW